MLEGINAMFNHPTVRKIFLKLRVVLGIGLLALILRYGHKWIEPLGFAISMLGAAIQLWSFSALVKEKELTTRGPYVLVRNPMYLGRYFLLLGFVILLGNLWMAIAFTILYGFYMVNRVRREEVRLERLLGEPYREYCRTTRRFLPMLSRIGDPRVRFFNFAILRTNHGGWNLLATLCAWAIVTYD